MWLQTIESMFLWRYGTELVLYSVYSLLRFVTFGAIDAFIRGFWNIDKLFYPTGGDGGKGKKPVDLDKKGASSKTEDGDLEVSPSAVVDTAAL